AEPFKQNESPSAAPEYPGVAEVTEMAVRQAIGQVRHLYTAWSDAQEISFLDEKDCNLRAAWELLRSSDYYGLLKASRSTAESCRGNARTTAAAWYDLGIAYMLVQNYADALRAFEKSGKLHDFRQAEDLVAECRRNQAYAEALARQMTAWERQRPAGKPG